MTMPDAGVILRCAEIGLLILAPVLFAGAILYAPRGVAAISRVLASRRARRNPLPCGPPIEQIAAHLRRLLWEHDAITRSSGITAKARRLWAVEAAISDHATQAARALGVPHPVRLAHGALGRPQLRRLLHVLAAEGLVVPAAVVLMARDSYS